MYHQKFTGSTEQLAAIRDFVTRAARALGASDDDVFACELAADEAASNAFEHAYAERGGTIEIKMAREGNALVLSLFHWGTPFDQDEIPEPNLAPNLQERTLGGLGLYLIRRMMDDVSFQFDPVAGNRITLRRELNKVREKNPI